MTRPTLKAVLLFAVSIPPALLIVVVFREYWFIALYMPALALVLMIIDMLVILPANQLEVMIKPPQQLYIGRGGEASLIVTIENFKRSTPIQTMLEVEGLIEDPVVVTGLLKEGSLRLDLPLIPLRRGQIKITAVWLRWQGPLGLAETKRRHPYESLIDVVPDIKSVHEAAVQFLTRDAVYGVKTQRLKGEGTEFEALREFMPGMDSRFIDWKRSARHIKLLGKEFQQERNHQIVFGFDTGHLMLEPVEGMPKLDHAIKAGLLMSWVSLHNGDFVGSCGFDSRFHSYIRPGRGMPHFLHLQRFTSTLDYKTEETNFTLGLTELNSRLQRRTLVVLFTEFVDSISAELLIESLQLMLKRHVIIFVTLKDPMLTSMQDYSPKEFTDAAKAVTASDFLNERAIVLERIMRMGVHCLDTSANGISVALINRYLMIKHRGLL